MSKHSQFFLYAVVVSCKVTADLELMTAESSLPKEIQG